MRRRLCSSGLILGLTALFVGCLDLLQDPASPPATVLALTFTLPSAPSTGASQTSARVATTTAAPGPANDAANASPRLTGGMTEAVPDIGTAGPQPALMTVLDVDEVRLQILRGETTVRDTTVQLAPAGEETRIRIELELADSREMLSVRVELLLDGRPAFRGEALVSLEVGATAEVHIEPEPIPAGVSIPERVLELADIGESVQLTGHVISVTGDSIPDLALTWETLDPEVVDVTSDGLVTALAPGEARVVGAHGAFSDTVNVRVRQTVHSVIVEPTAATLHEGQSQQFTATLLDSGGDPLAEQPVAWTSSNAEVATVDPHGLVTAAAAGEAVITATSEGVEGQAIVTVVREPVDRIEVRPESAEVVEGETVQLTATPQNADGEPLPDRPVTWSSSDTDVATVNAAGLVAGIAPGSATIRATADGVSGEARIIVVPTPVASVLVEPSEATLQVGTRQQFTATALDGDGNPLNGRPVTWSSSDDTVATVDDNGLVRALAPGETVITATSEGVEGRATVTVVQEPVDRIDVQPQSAEILEGATVQLTATPQNAAGEPLPDRPVSWGSSNPQVATVNATGLVTGVAPGEATIRATSEGVAGEARVSVRARIISVTILSPKVSFDFRARPVYPIVGPDEPITLSGFATGGVAPYRYLWKVNWPYDPQTDAEGPKTADIGPDSTRIWRPSDTMSFSSCEVNRWAKLTLEATDADGYTGSAFVAILVVRIC